MAKIIDMSPYALKITMAYDKLENCKDFQPTLSEQIRLLGFSSSQYVYDVSGSFWYLDDDEYTLFLLRFG